MDDDSEHKVDDSGWWIGAWCWINWEGGEWNCLREWWQHCNVNCRNVITFIGFFMPQPNFVPLSSNVTWARGSDSLHSELLGTKRVNRYVSCSQQLCLNPFLTNTAIQSLWNVVRCLRISYWMVWCWDYVGLFDNNFVAKLEMKTNQSNSVSQTGPSEPQICAQNHTNLCLQCALK